MRVDPFHDQSSNAPMHALDAHFEYADLQDDRVCQVHALRSSLSMSWSVEDMLATIVYALTLALTLTPSPTHAHPRHVTAHTHIRLSYVPLMHSCLSLDQLTDMPPRCAIAWPRCLGRYQHFKNVTKRCTRRSPREPPCTSAQRSTHRHHGRECFWGLDRDGVDTTAKGGRPVSGATCHARPRVSCRS
jgi:hypothetical protein